MTILEKPVTKIKHNYDGMEFVKSDYQTSGLSDSEFAKRLTEHVGRPYSTAQVRAYRAALGIENNKATGGKPSADLEQAISLLRKVRGIESSEIEELVMQIDVFLAGR